VRPAGHGAAFQRLIPPGKQSSLLMHIRDDGKRFIVSVNEKLTALLELEKVTRESLRLSNTE
jgi:hypothetical protein